MNALPCESIQRDVIVKKESITDPSMGFDIGRRPVETLIYYGIINIDKPKGPTSHQVSDYVQKILDIDKAGHAGTLDPAVTGVLPIALCRATRIVQALLPAGKEYVCIMHLHKDAGERKIKKVFRQFTGKIRQTPPIKSAVRRKEREREVYYLDIMERDSRDILFKVGCEAGTYIRKLVHDMGAKLGTGAHMASLRRTKAACFGESSLFTLQDLADAYYYWKEDNNEAFIRKIVQPMESALSHLSKIWVNDSAVEALCHGRPLAVPGISKLHNNINPEDAVALMTLKNELIAIADSAMTSLCMLKSRRGIAAQPKKVFMKEHTYA
ncbi:RNA-guided pseudouridylation complex pseudouridine synthase subunit Cbf5 [Candidatus Woesearchaeota archaeon]|nr:RNA-guided pseudouridylation complex pseudouridine synthase subunit Cbf5 [Candidatus Woesearchaeota archaeon]